MGEHKLFILRGEAGGRPGCPFWCGPLGHQASPPLYPLPPARNAEVTQDTGFQGFSFWGWEAKARLLA